MATTLNKQLITRLLDEERLMKPGESDGFTIDICGSEWHCRLKMVSYTSDPFKYVIITRNPETENEMTIPFADMQTALLYCANGFNLNRIYTTIKDVK